MLVSEEIPPIGVAFGGGPCDYCTYREAAGKALIAQFKKQPADKNHESKD